MTEWWRESAVDIASAIRTGSTTAEEVLESHLSRVETVNEKLNAITVRMDDDARRSAVEADRSQRNGEALGLLHGVPVTIKENVDLKGHPTTNGVSSYADNEPAEHDSPVVSNLRKAGAIIIGRTNTPEFSLRYMTDNELRGRTRNPWHPDLTPGGSSGGASAACASGMCPINHGNDLGGSVRYPAYACGLAGIRPTLGRVPAHNPSMTTERPLTIQLMSVQGPLARTVAECRMALEAMSMRDIRDPWWVPAPLNHEAPHEPPRAAICADPSGEGVHPQVGEAVRRAGDALNDAGYQVTEVPLDSIMDMARLWNELLLTEAQLLMEPDIREFGSPQINTAYDNYKAARNLIRGNAEPIEDLESYLRQAVRRATYLRELLEDTEEYGVIVGPVSTEPPLRQGEDLISGERVAEIFTANRLTVAINLVGLPSVSVSTGATDNVPSGVQIIAGRYREDMALDAAEVIERACGIETPIDPLW